MNTTASGIRMNTALATRVASDTARDGNGETEVLASDIVISPPSVLAPMMREEIDAAIQTARTFPRSITSFLDKAMSWATLNPAVAQQCIYSKPRSGGKPDEGPSVRLAEIVASTFGNIRVDARIINVGERYVTAQAVAQDLEANNTWRSEVQRGIWGKHGRYSEDMILTTCNAAISIASRNVIFRVVPRALYWPIYTECRRIVMEGGKGTIEERRSGWIRWALGNGVKEAELYAALGVKGQDDIGVEQFTQLHGFQTAIDTGELTWDEVFRSRAEPAAATGNGGSRVDQLADRLKRQTEAVRPVVASGTESAPPGEFAGWLDAQMAVVNSHWLSLCEQHGKKYKPLVVKHQVGNALVTVWLGRGLVTPESIQTEGKRDNLKVANQIKAIWTTDAEMVKDDVMAYFDDKLGEAVEDSGIAPTVDTGESTSGSQAEGKLWPEGRE